MLKNHVGIRAIGGEKDGDCQESQVAQFMQVQTRSMEQRTP